MLLMRLLWDVELVLNFNSLWKTEIFWYVRRLNDEKFGVVARNFKQLIATTEYFFGFV